MQINTATITILFSVVSLIVSIITLYVAHLRGPNIALAIPGKVYPCHGFISNGVRDSTGEVSSHFTLRSNLLIANTGISSGVVFSFRVDPGDDFIVYYKLNPPPENMCPTVLQAGEGEQIEMWVEIRRPKSETWLSYLEKTKLVHLRAVYLVSASYGRRIEKTTELSVDLTPLYAKVKKDILDGYHWD